MLWRASRRDAAQAAFRGDEVAMKTWAKLSILGAAAAMMAGGSYGLSGCTTTITNGSVDGGPDIDSNTPPVDANMPPVDSGGVDTNTPVDAGFTCNGACP